MLRRVLLVDCWSTAAFGVVMLAGAGPLSGPLGLPVAWSVPFGVLMLAGAGVLWLVARRVPVPRRHGLAVVAGNALSGAGMVALTFSGLLPLTAAGVVFMLVGALVVAVYAALEYAGLRRQENPVDAVG